MKKLYLFVFLLLNCLVNAQVLPINRYYKPSGALNAIEEPSTLGYSLRKLNNTYTGFAVNIRRNSSQNPEANVAFDTSDIVSGNSTVTITKAGNGLSVGQTMTLTTFISSNSVYVKTWYNQGDASLDATQTTNANQPQLLLNTAGSGNTKPSLYFDGTGDFLIINQPVEVILDQGIRGSFMIAVKPTGNTNHFTFGYRNASTDWRWSFHINWSNGYCYFDSAETCCATNRRFYNSGNINSWKQYTFVRGTTYKTARVSGAATALNNSPAASTSQTGGEFRIGSTANNPNGTYTGYMSELLMFPTDLALSDIIVVENNQIAFWNL